MSLQHPARFAIALLASLSLLGATSRNASSMYLRIATMRAAPVVSHLSYDAVATVPGRPHTAAALLAPDRVEGSMIVTFGGTAAPLDAAAFKGVSKFVVVAIDGDRNVVMRTAFDGVTIRSVHSIAAGDGTTARQIDFDATRVTVSGPKTT